MSDAAARGAALEALAVEIEACRACPLGSSRTRSVPGEGSPTAEIVFVGEGPGATEDVEGRPFVGAAGRLLGGLLALIGLRRDDVYILNVVKCHPPANRDPEPEEVAACAPFLRRQMEILDPLIVAPLGRHALHSFAPAAKISAAHGSVVSPAAGAPIPTDATLLPLYHPAAALHNGSLRPTLERDVAALARALDPARARRAAARGAGGAATLSQMQESPEQHQLRLFEGENP
jgi:DNA polymerase